MAFIVREDGEQFVIPSYRDVLVAKQKSGLKKDVIALSQSYGECLAMQRRSPQEYEVAFSPDQGYLLGETVWHHFNRPVDMIYCEVLPNTGDAILVIVKNGSVYLDGSFPVDSIPDELVVFLTQENNFEIYISADAPISETPTDGKFSFDPGSVKAFNVLPEPVFNTLPLLKAYHLLPLEETLMLYGVGSMHILPFILAGALLFIIILVVVIVKIVQRPTELKMEPNPFQVMVDALASPPPDVAVQEYVKAVRLLTTMPGWEIKSVTYKGSSVDAQVVSGGTTLNTLLQWCGKNGVMLMVKPTGIETSIPMKLTRRPKPKLVYPLKQSMIILLDRIRNVYPGDHIKLVGSKAVGPFTNIAVKIDFIKASPGLLALIGQQFKGLPLTMETMTMINKQGLFDGGLTVKAYGT